MDELPILYRLLAFPIDLLDKMGVGRALAVAPRQAEEMKKVITTANVRLEVGRVRCAQVAAALAVAGFFAFLACAAPEAKRMGLLVLGVLIGSFMGWNLPWSGVQSQAKNRQAALLRALPFAIDLLAAAMRAGLDFGAALRYYVGLGIRGPLTQEFSKALSETELGVSRVNALLNMAGRVRIKEFTAFVSAIALGSEMGASISQTMAIQGEEMRKVRFNVAEQKAQRAPSIMIMPMALFIMPAVFVIIITPVVLKLQMAKGGL